jgi:hypothetical protein
LLCYTVRLKYDYVQVTRKKQPPTVEFVLRVFVEAGSSSNICVFVEAGSSSNVCVCVCVCSWKLVFVLHLCVCVCVRGSLEDYGLNMEMRFECPTNGIAMLVGRRAPGRTTNVRSKVGISVVALGFRSYPRKNL